MGCQIISYKRMKRYSNKSFKVKRSKDKALIGIKKIKKKKNTFREVCTKVGIVNFINSRVLLAGLKDQPVTRGMKNTPPLAAVENIGQ